MLFSAFPVEFCASQENIAAHVIEIIVYEHSEESPQLQHLYLASRSAFSDVGGYEVVGIYFYKLFDKETIDIFFSLAFEVFHEVVVEGNFQFIILQYFQ